MTITNEMFNAIANELRRLSGLHWEPMFSSQSEYCYLDVGDGKKYSLMFVVREKTNQVSIIGGFGDAGKYLEHYQKYDINCSLSKSPEQIAKEINKRLLPIYLPDVEKANKEKEKWENLYKSQADTLNLFAELLGSTWRVQPKQTESLRFSHNVVNSVRTLGSDRVELKLTLPTKEAFDLVETILHSEADDE